MLHGMYEMKKFYADEWMEIKFSSFASVTTTRTIADANFYSEFYKSFYKKYQSYDDMSVLWKETKDETAEHIYSIIMGEGYGNILSIGCGIGYIECLLAEKSGSDDGMKLTALDPSVGFKQWCKNEKVRFLHGFFPNVLEKTDKYDFAYATAIEYVFDDEQYVSFLKSILNFGINNILLTELSVQERLPLKYYVRDALNWLYSLVGLYEYGQFWGYRRTLDEHKRIFKMAGFRISETGKYNSGKYWIRGIGEPG